MAETVTGLVLRTRPLTETSLIVHWLTPRLGRLATVAKGARRPKSLFRGKLDLFYRADFSFSRSRASDLHTLREVSVVETHAFLRQNLGCLRQAAYGARLIEQATEMDTPLGGVFELLDGLLGALASQPPRPQLIFSFELKLLAELGLQPNLGQAELSGGAKAIVRNLGGSEWERISGLRLNPAQCSELDRFLRNFLEFHLGRVPKGRAAALALSA